VPRFATLPDGICLWISFCKSERFV